MGRTLGSKNKIKPTKDWDPIKGPFPRFAIAKKRPKRSTTTFKGYSTPAQLTEMLQDLDKSICKKRCTRKTKCLKDCKLYVVSVVITERRT